MHAAERLKGMTNAIVEAVHPRQVVLFGSQARGDARADSDIDLLVVEREPFGAGRSRWAEFRVIRQALRSFPGAKDVLVFSEDEVTKFRNSLNHVVGLALREGKVLYEA